MAASFCDRAAGRPEDVGQLRLLLELAAMRRLADRGLSDQEVALGRKLADRTMQAARSGDVPGYLRADVDFHLGLLDLTGDRIFSDVARLVFAPDPAPAPDVSVHLMAREAREHRELVGMCGDGLISAADHLLRLHLSRLSAGRPASALLAEPEPASPAGA
jgi:DNA-binding GntR family transcriptional regulator